MRSVGTLLILCAAPAPGGDADLRLPLDAADRTWAAVDAVDDGMRGGAARFGRPGSRIDAGPCPADSRTPFTLRVAIRTTQGGFATPVMARDGPHVGFSLVLGRRPGCISLEMWNWEQDRAQSSTRVDDGRWHEIEAVHDPSVGVAALFVDGRLEASMVPGPGGAPGAALRLGNNVGTDQPFQGDLDELTVSRTVARAEALAALAPTIPPVELEAALAAVRGYAFRSGIPELRDPAAWTARRASVRAAVEDCLALSPRPSRAALDVRVHGERTAKGLRVARLSWSTFPGQRATGWLWLPDPSPPGARPAVLHPHGHWPLGALDPVVQRRAARFARSGWVSLVPDSVHVEDVAAGLSGAAVMTWNNLRALDLLAARDDVDPARIAVTGGSGGAQQTIALMALDDRIAAAAPIAMACWLSDVSFDRVAHCGCNHVPRLAALTDVPEMCAVFAPRPVLFGSVTGDWTRDFPRRGYPELRRAWELAGCPESCVSVHRDEEHNYDRPFRDAVHAAFAAWLGKGADVSEAPFDPFPPGELLQLGAAAAPDRATLAAELLSRRPRFTSMRDAAPGLPWAIRRSAFVGRGERSGWTAAHVDAADGAPVPVIFRDDAPGTDDPWVLVVNEAGKGAWAASPPRWAADVRRIAVVDPRLRGEWSPFASAWRRNGILLGRGEGYQAAHDVAQTAESLPGSGAVTLIGTGSAGVDVLVAAHLSPRARTVVATDVGRPYAADGNRLPLLPEILRFGDLPDIVAAIPTPRTILIGGADGVGEFRRTGPGVLVTSTSPLDEGAVSAVLRTR